MKLAHPSAIRVQCRNRAPARFWWPFFGNQQETQSQNQSGDVEARNCAWNAGFLMRLGSYSQAVPSVQTTPQITLMGHTKSLPREEQEG